MGQIEDLAGVLGDSNMSCAIQKELDNHRRYRDSSAISLLA
jgi:hypothetical protein